LSTLTKVLIVLLTVFSIFLCGIVVTYVASAENQKAKADNLQRTINAAKSREADAQQQLEEEKQKAQADIAKLNEQILAFDTQIKNLQGSLEMANREKDQLVQKVATMAAAVETTTAASKQQTTLFETAQQEVRTLRTEQENRQKELDETNQMLLDKMAVIADLQAKVRQLTEENQDVQARLNQYFQQYGRIATKPATTVAPRSTAVQPAPMAPTAQTRTIDLNGQVTAVDMNSKLAEISIGAAAGVRPEMKFHVIRGDRVVCDIRILEVWPDKAVGTVELVQQGMEPRAGDRVSSNL
jgi:peptidoglycan hydrolase CwlO-like protein